MRKLSIALVVAYWVVCLGLMALADEMLAVSCSPLFYVVGIALLLPAVLPVWRKRIAQFGTLAYVAVLVLLPFASFTPTKPFRQFYRAVQYGMTQDQMREELGRRFSRNGRFPCPVEHASDEGLSFQLDPNNGRYNAELVVVKVVDGRVVAKEYLPD